MVRINNLELIRIDQRDEAKGFYTLFISDYSIVCLPDNEYIIPKCMLKKLRKKKIKFKLVKKKWQ